MCVRLLQTVTLDIIWFYVSAFFHLMTENPDSYFAVDGTLTLLVLKFFMLGEKITAISSVIKSSYSPSFVGMLMK